MRRWMTIAVCSTALASCALFTDLSGLAANGLPLDAGSDGAVLLESGALDSSVPPAPDAAGDGAPDAVGAPVSFTDDFDGPESDAIGDGWSEKSPAVFSRMAGTVTRSDANSDYRDNLVLRPEREDRRDVEVSVDVRSGNAAVPQVVARVERATAFVPDTYRGYILYLLGNVLTLGRQEGNAFVGTLASSEATIAAGDVLRLRLRVQGTSPVVLEGLLEARDGTAWRQLARVAITDGSPTRITSAGAVGFASGDGDFVPVYETFSWRELTPP